VGFSTKEGEKGFQPHTGRKKVGERRRRFQQEKSIALSVDRRAEEKETSRSKITLRVLTQDFSKGKKKNLLDVKRGKKKGRGGREGKRGGVIRDR